MDCSRKTLVLNYSSNYRVSPFIKFEYDILFKVEMIKGKKKKESITMKLINCPKLFYEETVFIKEKKCNWLLDIVDPMNHRINQTKSIF